MKPYWILLFPLLLWNHSVYAAEAGEILSTCSKDHSHVEMSGCIEQSAAKSEATLNAAESTLLDRIAKRDEEPTVVAGMKKAYEEGNEAFKNYRDNECQFYGSMAAGGNGANDLRMACTAALNASRADQLRWVADNWK